MSLHESLIAAIHRLIDGRRDCAIISPGAVAMAVFTQLSDGKVEPHIACGSIEHFKRLSRGVLRGRFDHGGEDNPVYSEQGELFSGHLQVRYPVPRKKDEEPVYKRLEDLTPDELKWNVRSLRRSADARLAHADALHAYATSKLVA